MKILKKSLLFLTTGLLLGGLTGCFGKKNEENKPVEKDPLVIPTVNVESLNITLPNLPSRNAGTIRNDENYEYIDLYELSDFHGAVDYEVHSDGNYVGLQGLANYMDQKREANPGGTLLLSAGDMFQGSANSNLTRGFMVNYCMQYMGFDAMAVGNHEFDWSADWIRKNAELKYNTSTSLPILGANILKDEQLPSFLKKSVVVSRGTSEHQYKIGVIGVIGSALENTILKTMVSGYDFVSYKNIVSEEAARLKSEEGCQAVVLLAHEAADQLETGITGVDAMFGGHAHEDKTAQYGSAHAAATRNYGQSVAHIALKFNKSTMDYISTEAPEIVPMQNYGEHTQIKAIMDQYAPEINKIKDIKLGTADAELAYDKALKNICTLSMFEAASEAASKNAALNVDSSKIVASFHNVNGGIRDNIAAGDVTYGSVYKAFPFDNEVVLIKTTGEEIKSKIRNLDNLGIYRIFEKMSYFDPSEEYYIVTTDFIALSDNYFGAPYRHVTDEDLIRTGRVVRDEVANKIYKLDKLVNKELSENKVCYRPVANSDYFG